MRTWRLLSAILLISVVAGNVSAQRPALRIGPLLHAHNCYPEDGNWTDRIDRALGTGLMPIAIEQDVVWSSAAQQPVVSHGLPLTGQEPSLDDYFFKRVAPILDAALRARRTDTWPVMILHLDFKTNEPEHHRAIWNLLGRYERWLTTAVRGDRDDVVQPMKVGPLLVLTENGPGQSKTFYDEVPVGGGLRLFGTIPSGAPASTGNREADADAAMRATPADLIPTGATNYRRWTNFAWLVVEHGGQTAAGEWTEADTARLTSIVDRAHTHGLWIRFYTLNGHAPDANRGWTASYNFGSIEAARLRWRAAIAAGVDLIATDQYEEFARERGLRSNALLGFAAASGGPGPAREAASGYRPGGDSESVWRLPGTPSTADR